MTRLIPWSLGSCLLALVCGCPDQFPAQPCPGFRDLVPTASSYALPCSGSCISYADNCKAVLDINRGNLRVPMLSIRCDEDTSGPWPSPTADFLEMRLQDLFSRPVGTQQDSLTWVFQYEVGGSFCNSWNTVPALKDLPPLEHPVTVEVLERAGSFVQLDEPRPDVKDPLRWWSISEDYRMVVRIQGQRSEPLVGWDYDEGAKAMVPCDAAFENVTFDFTFELTRSSFEFVEDLSGTKACG